MPEKPRTLTEEEARILYNLSARVVDLGFKMRDLEQEMAEFILKYAERTSKREANNDQIEPRIGPNGIH